MNATSVEAFEALIDGGKIQPMQAVVLEAFIQDDGEVRELTRQDIAELSGLPLNSVCGRVNALLHPSVGLLKVVGIDKSSGRSREVLTLNVEESDAA